MHAPKLQARPVQVLQVENDAWGKPRALVRHRMGSVKQNPARQVVSTRQRRKRRRARVSIAPAVTQTRRTAMRGLATGTTQRGGIKDWWCSRFPSTCKEIATPCGPGYEPDPSKPGGCLPSGSGPTSPNPRMLARAVKARKNPIPGTEMSGYQRAYNPTVGAHRYQANRGVRDRVGRILRAIGRGDASVSLGRDGISINEKAA
jgi:hypothetical protein